MENVTGYNKRTIVIITMFVSAICSIGLILFAYLTEHHSVENLLFEITIVWVTCGVLAAILQRLFDRNLLIIENILNSNNDAIIVKDYDSKFVFCNVSAAELYETDPKNMVGKDDYYFTKNKEQSDFFLKNTQEIIDNFEEATVYESFADKISGQVSHYSSLKVPFKDVNGELKIIVFARDITDITQLKESSEKNKQRLAQILEVSEEGLWEWNTQTNQVAHNPQWEAIMGIESSQNTFAEFLECVLPEDRHKVDEALHQLAGNNTPYNIEFRIKKPNGNIIWVWDRGSVAEYDEHGAPVWLVGIVLDITEQKANQIQVERLAYYDPLTGLNNRAQLEKMISKTITEKAKNPSYSAILFLDLDRFKLLNDSYGHQMGDQLLQKMAVRLSDEISGEHFLGRFGGDEFIIICPDIAGDEESVLTKAADYANRLVGSISKTFTLNNGHHDEDIEYDIAISVGGIIFNTPDVEMGYLLQLADIAMYRAKIAGGQQSKIYTLDSQSDLTHSSQLIRDMRYAIQQQDFQMYLQPKVDGNGQVIGSEALVRWMHRERGMLVPGVFIDQAEESNLIIKIGQQVLELACQKLNQWQQDDSTKDLTISVNLSAKQLWQSHFVEQFVETLDAYNINHNKLIIEVTESVLIQDIKDATEKLIKLKNSGVSISLDDFGTGYSSLNYLHRLPIDEIKIDRSFVQDSTQDTQTELMVKSIIDLANNFDLSVVAEGVETVAQFELLKSLGVDVYQGFLFAKPMCEKVFAEFIDHQDGSLKH
ncbi:EAL domain-containing protein [Marinomonas sp.]